MTFSEQIEALERLHSLIRRKATGTPEELAKRFRVSVGTIYNFVKILRNKDMPIHYCREKETYYYEYDVDLVLFQVVPKEDLRKIRGGKTFLNFFSPLQNFCSGIYDL
jgi:HTH domain